MENIFASPHKWDELHLKLSLSAQSSLIPGQHTTASTHFTFTSVYASLSSRPREITALLTFLFHGWCIQIDLLAQTKAIYCVAASAQIITVVNSHPFQRIADELQNSERCSLACELWVEETLQGRSEVCFCLTHANFSAPLDWHIIVLIAKDVWSETKHICRGGGPAAASLIRERWGLRLMSCAVGRVKHGGEAGKYLIFMFNHTAGKDDVALYRWFQTFCRLTASFLCLCLGCVRSETNYQKFRLIWL